MNRSEKGKAFASLVEFAARTSATSHYGATEQEEPYQRQQYYLCGFAYPAAEAIICVQPQPGRILLDASQQKQAESEH